MNLKKISKGVDSIFDENPLILHIPYRNSNS